jgi:hypothetical protein
MKIPITPDELKVLAAAISWTLWSPFYRSPAPEFSGLEKERLQAIFDEICRELHLSGPEWSATLDTISLILRGRTVATGSSEMRVLRICLDACYAEIGHSPMEVLAVTGLPSVQYFSLLERVSKLSDEAGVTMSE